MTKEQFLKRCETAWEAGLASPEVLRLLEEWVDSVMQLEGGQMSIWSQFLEAERRRTHGFHSSATLANDAAGHQVIQLAALLNHPCQACSEDPDAWWTRPGLCLHRKLLTNYAL